MPSRKRKSAELSPFKGYIFNPRTKTFKHRSSSMEARGVGRGQKVMAGPVVYFENNPEDAYIEDDAFLPLTGLQSWKEKSAPRRPPLGDWMTIPITLPAPHLHYK